MATLKGFGLELSYGIPREHHIKWVDLHAPFETRLEPKADIDPSVIRNAELRTLTNPS